MTIITTTQMSQLDHFPSTTEIDIVSCASKAEMEKSDDGESEQHWNGKEMERNLLVR